MRVVFVGCAYPPEMHQYTRGLAEVGAEVLGVGDGPVPERLKPHLAGYLQVPRLLDEDDVIARITAWLRGKSVDRVLANWEPVVILAARLREKFGLGGMSVDTVRGFRDKQLMKERVAAAGLRVPRSERATTAKEVWAAAERIGYPMILKPIAGAGSADTYRCDSRADLERVLGLTQHVEEVSCEEFIEGDEYTFDTVSIGGKPAYQNVAQYLPKPIIARSEEWVSPVVITVRDLSEPRVQAGQALGEKVLTALGMGDGFTHMEWFRKPDGEAVFGEIGCRPPGAHLVDQMNYTSDIDLFREWARVACWQKFEAVAPRKYNCGVCFKRAQGQGRITAIRGLHGFLERNGAWVVEEHLLKPGTHRRNWKQTLISDGHIMLRHPSWDEAYRMSFEAATNITLFAGG